MRRCGVVWLVVAVVAAMGVAGAESQLAGVGIGQSPRTLMASVAYGSPNAMITAPMTYNPMAPPGTPLAGYAALPAFAKAVAPMALEGEQLEWIYQRGQISLGFIFEGRGPDALVSDIIVAMWNRQNVTAPDIRTEEGITLNSSFRDVLLAYGYPVLLQTLRAAPTAPSRSPQMALPPGGRPAAGTGALPPLQITAAPTAVGETTATVGLSTETFTKHCILSYPGVTFTLFNMKVVRIHIYEPPERPL